MNLEQTLVALKEAFSGKTAEAEAHATELTKAKEALASFETEKAALAGLADSLKADKVALESKVAALEGELTKANALVAAAIEAQKAAEAKIETAGKKAAEIAASVGVDAVEVSPVDSAAANKSNEEIAQEWAVLRQKDAKAASEFYTKNRTAIIAASGLR